MALPFTRDQFFEVFARYNEAIWPAQVLLFAAALACVAIARSGPGPHRALGWALAALMTWVAVVYHFAFFAEVNPAAWLFGSVTLVGGAVIAWHAWNGRLRFDGPRDPSSTFIGWASVVYALGLYPIIGMLSGQSYPRLPTFGAPCPTTIFVFGMLLLARRPVPASVFAVPILWSIVATSAALTLGVYEDFALPVVAIAAVIVLVLRARATGRRAAETAA